MPFQIGFVAEAALAGPSRRRAVAAIAIAFLMGCEGVGPQDSVRIRTDSFAYTLQYKGWYEVVVRAEITNFREETVYLARGGCGSRAVIRPDGQHLTLSAPGRVCASIDPPVGVVAIASGETHVERVPLIGSLSSMGSSTMANLTGLVRLWIAIGPVPWEVGEHMPALLPEEERRTNVFRIDPPAVSYLEPHES